MGAHVPVAVTIQHWTRGNRILRYRFNQSINDALKELGAWFEPAERAWVIPTRLEGTVIELLQHLGCTVTVERPTRAQEARA